MNRLLKILLSILTVHTPIIKKKIKQIFSDGITKKGLMKPILGLQLWGPRFQSFDINSDVDASDRIPENQFSTFNHVRNADCPSYTDNSKKIKMRTPVLLKERPIILAIMVAVWKVVFAYPVKILKIIQKLTHLDALTIILTILICSMSWRTFPYRDDILSSLIQTCHFIRDQRRTSKSVPLLLNLHK